jgi:hypothetical protein
MSSTSTSLVPRTAARPKGSKASSWLRSRRGMLVLAAVAGIAARASGWYWLASLRSRLCSPANGRGPPAASGQSRCSPSWEYSYLMAVVLLFRLGVGLSPLVQWIAVPSSQFG